MGRLKEGMAALGIFAAGVTGGEIHGKKAGAEAGYSEGAGKGYKQGTANAESIAAAFDKTQADQPKSEMIDIGERVRNSYVKLVNLADRKRRNEFYDEVSDKEAHDLALKLIANFDNWNTNGMGGGMDEEMLPLITENGFLTTEEVQNAFSQVESKQKEVNARLANFMKKLK